eukprot:Amastigsp_a340828_45.p4 type:complete len:121 gc:universal Amastigsp_a340828_45:997-1359(+)
MLNANRVACQVFCIKFRYPTMRSTSRLMSRPALTYAQRPKRSASAPHGGMPSGKSAFWPSIATATSASGRLPLRTVSWSSSRVMPSITATGSMTLPSDLLILRPCASRTIECRNTYSKGS